MEQMKINIAICDDVQEDITLIKENIDTVIRKNMLNAAIHVYNSGETFLDKLYEDANMYDILFLDVDMPNVQGYEVADCMMKRHSNTLIIYVSATPDNVFNSFEHSPFRFIRKSQLHIETEPALIAARDHIQRRKKSRTIQFETKQGTIMLPHNTIGSIESELRTVKIYTIDGKVYGTKESIGDIFQRLDNDMFLFINRGIIVNIENISGFNKEMVYLYDKRIVYISRRRKKEVERQISLVWRDL